QIACRSAKEFLLADAHEDEVATPVTLLGRGGRLIGGALKTSLTRDRIEHVLDGFFPNVTPLSMMADANTKRARRTGMVSLGLPYATEPAITRHLARFLAEHQAIHRDEPVALLLNGGVFHARAIVSRVAQAIESVTGARPILLGLDDHRGPRIAPDLAVARGAVAHGLAREGVGRTIGGGSPRSLFVALGDGRALCVSPKGAPSGVRFVAADRKLALLTGATARFDLFCSSQELDVRAGDVLEVDARFDALPSVVTVIEARAGARELPVTLQSELTEIGTLDLFCVEESGATHRLAFELRARDDAPVRASLPPASRNDRRLGDAIARIDRVFGRARKDADPRDAKSLMRDLEKLLGPRDQWTVATLRPLADALLIDVTARKRSPEHERAFWSLAGYVLRPGFGDPRDSDRMRVVAPLASQLLTFGKEDDGWRAWWIAWRRIAGGLDETTQSAIRDVLDPFLELESADVRRPKKKPKNVRAEPLDEVWRLAGSLERVPTARKLDLGAWILDRTWTSQDSRLYEALGRLGARVPTYASVHHVVPGRTAERWLDDVLRVQWAEVPAAPLASVMLAQRTGDRAIDVSDSARQHTLDRLTKHGCKPEWIARVRDIVQRDDAQRRDALGDDWPIGLRLIE
ncbi:MAG: heat-shock protein Hsp70, partial [Polyangiales bacterium]